MTKPRSHYVDPVHPRYYHVTSRCVRRAWLLGRDPDTGREYDHRKPVFLNRLRHLSRYFAVEVMGYAVMSNHFHIVIHYDPREMLSWSDEEVARRWCAAFNGCPIDTPVETGNDTLEEFGLQQSTRYHTLLLDPERLATCRRALGSLSRFMQHLKQPFATWANHEDGCHGHFFEGRFYSGVLLTQEDLLACMAYVDLNPVEAGMATSLRDAYHTAIFERLRRHRFDVSKLEAYLAPLWQDDSPRTLEHRTCTSRQYVTQLNLAIVYLAHPNAAFPDQVESWMARLLNRERRKRTTQQAAFFDYS